MMQNRQLTFIKTIFLTKDVFYKDLTKWEIERKKNYKNRGEVSMQLNAFLESSFRAFRDFERRIIRERYPFASYCLRQSNQPNKQTNKQINK